MRYARRCASGDGSPTELLRVRWVAGSTLSKAALLSNEPCWVRRGGALSSAGDHPCGDRGARCVQVAERGGFHRRPPQVIAWAAIRRGVTWTGPGLWRGSAWRRGPWDPLGVAWSGVRVEQRRRRRRRRRDLGRAQSSLLSCDNNCGPMHYTRGAEAAGLVWHGIGFLGASGPTGEDLVELRPPTGVQH